MQMKLLPRRQFPQRPNILLDADADVELTSSLAKDLLDPLALLLMLLPVFVLTILVTIPNALAIPTLLEGITLRFARRTQLRRGGPIFLGGVLVIFVSFRRFAERHGAELFSCRRCSFLFR